MWNYFRARAYADASACQKLGLFALAKKTCRVDHRYRYDNGPSGTTTTGTWCTIMMDVN